MEGFNKGANIYFYYCPQGVKTEGTNKDREGSRASRLDRPPSTQMLLHISITKGIIAKSNSVQFKLGT